MYTYNNIVTLRGNGYVLSLDTCVDFCCACTSIGVRNYPTAENIARKKKSDEEKKARGEVAKTPLYR